MKIKKVDGISVKYKALILVMLMFIISTSLIVSFAIFKKSKEIDMFGNLYTNQMSNVYDYWINHIDTRVLKRLSVVIDNKEIIKYIKSADRDKLYSKSKDIFNTMKLLNPYIKEFNYYSSDNITFLRVQEREYYGDDISDTKPVIHDVITTKKPIKYYDMSESGLLYKITTPILDNGKLIAILEVGIKATYFVEQIKKIFNTDVYFFIREAECTSVNKDSISIGDFKLCEKCSKATEDIKNLTKEFKFEDRYNFNTNEKRYLIHTQKIYGYYGVNLANILVFKDVSEKYLALKSFIIFTVGISLVMMLLVYFLLSKLFDIIIDKLDRFKLFLSESKDFIYIIYPKSGYVIDSNKMGYLFLGLSEKELYKKRLPQILKCIDNTELDFDSFSERIKEELYIKRRDFLVKNDGTLVAVESTINYVHNRRKDGIILVMRDISEQVKLENELKYLANRDPLTKIYNRRKFYEELDKHFDKSKDNNKPLSMMMLDIDHFKSINDTYGHEAGDKTIKSIANILLSFLEEDYSVARWGGEEFVMLFPNKTDQEAYIIAEEIRKTVESYKFEDIGEVTASFGITSINNDDTVSSFTIRVDKALYLSKNSGRNRVSNL
jgi:diguanylate cyclase (GGDEF)-like protein/PAS domain S-box-containing protein